ncbi:MAG TPA: F0F1 ATP synthase subunit epsilon [Streptosporangiaceae bacterium]|nr:F0F1 ATP synthase subunit epsilon [Streptosporangiaceae bacterium]
MTLRVELVVPDGEIWGGRANLVIAKTLDGDIGVMSGHAPVIGILVEGSVVRIRPEGDGAAEVSAAVGGGFFSIANDRVSILARQAQLGSEVDKAAAQAALDTAQEAAGPGQDSADVRYLQAQLRAAGSGS